MQQAKQSFKESLAVAVDKPLHARTCFDALDKAKLREVLYREQHHICVYCERHVEEEDPEKPPIEHWRPLSKEPEHALEWENLYLSCAMQGTCDDSKQGDRLAWDAADASLPWPTQALYEDWVGFTSGGEMFVRSDVPLSQSQRRALALAIEDCDDSGQHRRSILNLNDAALVAARKAAIDSERFRLERDYPGRHASNAERSEIAAGLLRRDQYPAFVSVRLAWLRRSLGKGRP